jgi:hypothetical protein
MRFGVLYPKFYSFFDIGNGFIQRFALARNVSRICNNRPEKIKEDSARWAD